MKVSKAFNDLLRIAANPTLKSSELALFREALNENPDWVNLVHHLDERSTTTLLYTAARAGSHIVTALLLSIGADITIACTGGNTALHVSYYRGNLGCVDALSAHAGWRFPELKPNSFGESPFDIRRSDVGNVRAAAMDATVSQQMWYYLSDDCSLEVAPNQSDWEGAYRQHKSTFASSIGEVSFLGNVPLLTKKTSANSPPRPVLRLVRDKSGPGCVTDKGHRFRMWADTTSRRLLSVVRNFVKHAELEAMASAEPTRISFIDKQNRKYQFFYPEWFFRESHTLRLVAIDPNNAAQLTMGLRTGRPSYRSAANRVYDYTMMCSYLEQPDTTLNEVSQLMRIVEDSPNPVSVSDLVNSHRAICANVQFLFKMHSHDEILRDLHGSDGLKRNLSLIWVAMHVLKSTVKGGAVRDVVVGCSAKEVKDIDCELQEGFDEQKDLASMAQQLQTLGLPAQLSERAAFDNFLGKRSTEKGIFTFKVVQGVHKDVFFELVSPHCDCYCPPRNVDATANNLAVRADRHECIYQLVPLNISTMSIIEQILRKEASPVYDVAWERDPSGGTDVCVACAPTQKRKDMMQGRLDKMRRKGFTMTRLEDIPPSHPDFFSDV